jgi:hypothetical protein
VQEKYLNLFSLLLDSFHGQERLLAFDLVLPGHTSPETPINEGPTFRTPPPSHELGPEQKNFLI